jgi:DMSO reductase family type II enzyme heme b subunit
MGAKSVLAISLLLAAGASRAAEDALAADTVVATEAPGPLAADPLAPWWDASPALEVRVVPQRTVRLHDRRANAQLETAETRSVKVRAAIDGESLAVLLEWSDPTEDRESPTETDAHGDAAALQLPLRFGAGLRLPYVGMGDDALKVAVHLQRAGAAGTVGRDGIASGFGTLARADLGRTKVAMRRNAAGDAWRAVFVRPLVAGDLDLRRGLVPFAVAIWDGSRAERGGNKAISGWKLLRIPAYPADPAYAAELRWGRTPGELGDPVRGKQLVQAMCAACHAVGDRRVAPPGMAPDLTGIGAIATPAYLRQSIVDPSAVVVPGPDPAQHQDRAAKAPGRTGAYPASGAFAWFRRDAAGKKISRMPAYAGLPPPDVLAMVAYLSSLGAGTEGAGRNP